MPTGLAERPRLSPERATAAFSRRMEAGRAGLISQINAIWNLTFDPERPIETLEVAGAAIGERIAQAQTQALIDALDYLAELAGPEPPTPETASERAKPEFFGVGWMRNGRAVANLGKVAAQAYLANLAEKAAEAAAAATRALLNKIGATEPYRIANEALLEAARDDDRFSGETVLVPGPGACAECLDAAGTEAHAPIHPYCNCISQPLRRKFVTDLTKGMDPELAALLERYGIPREDWWAFLEPAPPPANYRGNWAKDVPLTGRSLTPAEERLVRDTIGKTLSQMDAEFAKRLVQVRSIEHHDPRSPELDAEQGTLAWFTPAYNDITLRNYYGKKGDQLLEWNDPQFLGYWTDNNGRSRRLDLTWFSERGAKGASSGMEYVTTHELGHFVHNQLTHEQDFQMWINIQEKMDELGASGTTGRFGRQYRYNAGMFVSQYALTDYHELVAEAWAEYTLADVPGPIAQVIGDTLVGFLG